MTDAKREFLVCPRCGESGIIPGISGHTQECRTQIYTDHEAALMRLLAEPATVKDVLVAARAATSMFPSQREVETRILEARGIYVDPARAPAKSERTEPKDSQTL